ncbi:MAG: anhydro-N-acetylmuramic acid kinase [Phycisphaeraceae bacterium]
MTDSRTRLVVGCMTGTSLDGLDVALVKITGSGLDIRAELLGHHALPLPEALRATLMSLASGEANPPITYMRAARALGELHADGVEQLLQICSPSLEGEGRGEGEALSRQADGDKTIASKIDFITAHGQTIWHAPGSRASEREDDHAGMSWQLFDPWPVVRRLNRPVCYDLRQADLIAGGEGAPLTPIADWVMYRDKAEVIFNLGGVCNATWLRGAGPQELKAFDLVPCNLLLNGLAERLLGVPYDRDGHVALSGRPRRAVCKAIEKHAMPTGGVSKSLGRESFARDWLTEVLGADPQASEADTLSSAIELICRMIGIFVIGMEQADISMVLAGGGARNHALVQTLGRELSAMGTIALSDDLGIPCEAREAMGFAVLGALSQDGVPISLPQVTGATNPGVAGVWAGLGWSWTRSST